MEIFFDVESCAYNFKRNMGKKVKTWLNDSEITWTSDPVWLEQESKQEMEECLEETCTQNQRIYYPLKN